MSVIAKWDGVGVIAGTTLTNLVGGSGDTKFDTVAVTSPGALTVQTGGLHGQRIEVIPPTSSSTNAHFWWQASLGGTYTQHAVRFYIELNGRPSGNGAGIFSIRDNVNVFLWWLDMNTSGILRLRNVGGTSLANSSMPMPLNQVLRIEAVYNAGSCTVYVFKGDSQVPIETLSGSGFDTASGAGLPQQVRFGTPNNANLLPHLYYANIAFSNTADLIGPISLETSSPWSVWDGTKEATLAPLGVWDGTALQNYPSTYAS